MIHCISFDELATYVFVLVDDWYQSVAPYYFKGKRGSKPQFSDSEVIILLLLMAEWVVNMGKWEKENRPNLATITAMRSAE